MNNSRTATQNFIKSMTEIQLTEVSLRDGLQNEQKILQTDQKVEMIRTLGSAGLTEMEVTSFVRKDLIPALADAADLVCATSALGLTRFALIPNLKGLYSALKTDVEGVTLVMSASEGHNQANLNRSMSESFDGISKCYELASSEGRLIRASISTVFGCPYDGFVDPINVKSLVADLVDVGFERIGLCDTIGVASPDQVYDLCSGMISAFPDVEFELHLHDTKGLAQTNAYAGYLAGIRRFDASICGLGGCPFAPGAKGNVATQDLLNLFDALGNSPRIDKDRLHEAVELVEGWFGPR